MTAAVVSAFVGCSAKGPNIATGANGIQGEMAPVEFHLADAQAPTPNYSCDTSACTVKFSMDIYPYMQSTGPGKCASGSPCHGGTQPPVMADGDSSSTYQALVGYTFASLALRYVQPCTPDVTQSGILCNLSTPGTCGASMPINGAASPSPELLQKITDWVKCGAPNN